MNSSATESVEASGAKGARGGADALVRKGEGDRLVVRCPRCRLNIKIAREEIPDD